MAPSTMRAVVFKDVKKVELEDRPVPTIQDPKDIIVKVQYTALCGRYIRLLFQFRQISAHVC
jgi:D-arabinose 1-dehydrogenase-like Zn-dependent alcohol dehydrogenase